VRCGALDFVIRLCGANDVRVAAEDTIHVVEKRTSSIRPSVREAEKWKSGEAEKWRSGVVEKQTSSIHVVEKRVHSTMSKRSGAERFGGDEW
jgi:hypothetical protein